MSDHIRSSYLAAAWVAARPILEDLADKPETAAVAVLSSSSGRDSISSFDRYSDFDICLLISIDGWSPSHWRQNPRDTYDIIAKLLPDWLPNFAFDIAVPWGTMEVNVHQMLLEYELDARTAWDGEKCDVYAHKCAIYHDPRGSLVTLTQIKTQSALPAFRAERARLANRLTWDIHRLPSIAAKRHGSEYGHHLINVAIDELTQFVFYLNDRFLAARKWRLRTIQKVGLLGTESGSKLLELLRCEPTSMRDLHRRLTLLQEIWSDLVARYDLPSVEDIRRTYADAALQLRRTPATSQHER